MNHPLLDVKQLKTHFELDDKIVHAVNGVSFSIGRKEIVALIGESGSGKSVTALSIMGLIPQPPGKVKSGEILFEGEDLLTKKEKALRSIRGNHIAMVYQEPMNSLNPRLTIGFQLKEALTLHHKIKGKKAKQKVIDMLKKVEIPEAEKRYRAYPHELSGGMRQRVMIAMALICQPKLLIADEPTTALDVTIQAEILELIKKLKEEYETSVLLITHDLGVVTEMADKIVVMYSGKIMEIAYTDDLYKTPYHPYTEALMKCIPRMNTNKSSLHVIKGNVPDLLEEPKGCEFYPRCEKRLERCQHEKPEMIEVAPRHYARCWLQEKGVNDGTE